MNDAQAREIVIKYKHMIMKFANRAARRTRLVAHDADDFFAVGATAAIRAIETFDPTREVPEAVWVSTVVRRQIEHEVKTAKCQGFTRPDGAIVCVPVDDWAAEADDGVLKAQLKWLEDKVARILNPHEREALMGVFCGEDGQTIADRRGVSKQRIEQLKKAAVEKLAKSARLTFRAA